MAIYILSGANLATNLHGMASQSFYLDNFPPTLSAQKIIKCKSMSFVDNLIKYKENDQPKIYQV